MKVSIIGTIDESHTIISGQYDRTEIVVDGLRNDGYEVRFSNMMDWKKRPLSVLFSIIINYFWSDAVIFVASLNGVRVNLNLINFLRHFKKKTIFQIAIGGKSNCVFVKNEKRYRDMIKKLSAVFVEIAPMVQEYKEAGIDRVYYLPNCKTIDKYTSRVYPMMERPFKFCTYSRVTPEKGIEEAINVVNRLNMKYGTDYCTLDIYGTYLEKDMVWFENLMSKTPETIKYKARIDRKDSISILGQYDLMLFPTRHLGEGVPGGLIDCYEAGLPIVVCNTSFMSTIVIDGQTGFVYDGNSDENFDKAILRYTEQLSKADKLKMREQCCQLAMQYDTSAVINTLSNHLGSVNK